MLHDKQLNETEAQITSNNQITKRIKTHSWQKRRLQFSSVAHWQDMVRGHLYRLTHRL